MRYRRMGNTGLEVSEISFGCGGNAGLMLRGSPAEQTRIVARALELGINYFDNSPDYGNGAAENNLGRVLKELGARPTICSKVEIRAADMGDIASHVVRSTEESLARMGVEQLDVLQIHNAPWHEDPRHEGKVYKRLSVDDYLRPGGALEGIERLRRDGKIAHAGFVTRGDDAELAARLFATGAFSMINVPYTLLNPTAGYARPDGLQVKNDGGQVLNRAYDADIGTAIYSALSSGFLTDASVDGAPRHEVARAIDPQAQATRDNIERARQVRFLALEHDISLAQAAIRFVLGHRGVSTVIGGFSAMDQLEEISAVSGAQPYPAADLERLAQIWGRNFGLPPTQASGR